MYFLKTILLGSVSGVGKTQTMVKATAVVSDSQVFWRQNRIVFLLAGILHEYADLSIGCGHDLFYLRTGLNEFGR